MYKKKKMMYGKRMESTYRYIQTVTALYRIHM